MLVATGFDLSTGDKERGTRYHLTKGTVSKHSGRGDRRIWNDEEVETAVRNDSECNKPISTRTRNTNASGCFVVMSKCD
jgi:hypothetical protein